VHIIDINVSKAAFAGRIISAFIRSSLILLVFYYVPTHLQLLFSYVPETYAPIAQYLANTISNTPLPYLGIVIALLAFIETVINSTWVYGVIIILTALSWLSFDLVLLSKGLLFADSVPQNLILTYQIPPIEISLIIMTLFVIVIGFLFLELGTIAKGIRVISRNRKKHSIRLRCN
jgi:hypothetical protein